MKFRVLLFGVAALVAGCSKPAPKTTIQQFMEGQVNPAGEFLFHSVEDVSDANGTRLKAPQTAADWKEVLDQLAVLQNAPAILTNKGVKVAPPGFKSEHPGIESPPEWIQATIAAHRQQFDRQAYRLQTAANAAAQAAQDHDPRALQRALDGVDKACESCHLHYFYPADTRAWEAAKEDGMTDKPGVF